MTAAAIERPGANEYAEYYNGYIAKVPDGDFLAAFAAQPERLKRLLGNLPSGEDLRLHEPYTWTLRQVIGHLIDVERLFSARLLTVAAGDQTPIPGMDQNEYVAGLCYTEVSMNDLLEEFAALRASNVLLTRRLNPSQLARMGTASDSPVSARANLFILCGHVEYHAEIMKQRLTQ